MPDLPRWTSKSGRIVLLGDSAHAMHPNAAQGFSQIIEDIGVLEFLIARDTRPVSNIPSITMAWQQIRKPRVERIKEYAKYNTQIYLSGKLPRPPPQGAGMVNVKSLRHVTSRADAKFASSEFVKWTLDFDAVGEVIEPQTPAVSVAC